MSLGLDVDASLSPRWMCVRILSARLGFSRLEAHNHTDR